MSGGAEISRVSRVSRASIMAVPVDPLKTQDLEGHAHWLSTDGANTASSSRALPFFGCLRCQQRLQRPRREKGAVCPLQRRPRSSSWPSGACQAVDHRDSSPRRADARTREEPDSTFAMGYPSRSKRLAAAESLRREGVARVLGARCPVPGARCRVAVASRARKQVGRDWRIRTRELENKPARLPTGLRDLHSL